MIPITPGARLPDMSINRLAATKVEPEETSIAELFGNKTTLLFAVPGAFTGTCSATHLPGYHKAAAALRAKGIEALYCLAVNDVFVLDAWRRSLGVGDEIVFLADADGALTRALGMEIDLGARLGRRSQRFALTARHGQVMTVALEPNPGKVTVSAAEQMLAQLQTPLSG